MTSRLQSLDTDLRALENKLEQGGGAKKIEKLHAQGKLSARERVKLLCDPGTSFLEIGLLVAYDQYDGQAPSAGVVT
ncbi:MAG TPA: acyl-CoA carboxylase subunit beta, partial [Gemmatimonadaceae bacterium]|nr:acyl-CoA carboxylase subunit beta [Gemmatimonadaceae bacterium]